MTAEECAKKAGPSDMATSQDKGWKRKEGSNTW